MVHFRALTHFNPISSTRFDILNSTVFLVKQNKPAQQEVTPLVPDTPPDPHPRVSGPLTELRPLPLDVPEAEAAGQGALPVAVQGLPLPVAPQLPQRRRLEGLGVLSTDPSRRVRDRPLHQVVQAHNHLLRHGDDLVLQGERTLGRHAQQSDAGG